MFVFIVLGLCILFLIIILILLRFCINVSPKANKCYQWLKSKLIWGIFIGYVFAGTLKLQLASGDVLYDESPTMLTPVKQAPETSTYITGTILISVLNICPFFFAFILWRYRGKLHIERTRKRI